MAVAELAGVTAEDFGAAADEDLAVADEEAAFTEDELPATLAEEDWAVAELAALAEELDCLADEELAALTDELDLALELDDFSNSLGLVYVEVLSSFIETVFVPESSEHPENARASAAMEAHFTKADVLNKLIFIITPYFFFNIIIDWIPRATRDDGMQLNPSHCSG